MPYPNASPRKVECAASFAAVVELTDEVQRAVQAGEWQQAAVLEARRRAVLEQLFIEHSGVPAELRAVLADLEERGQRLTAAVREERGALLRQSEELRRGQRAAAAYGSTGIED